MTQDKNFWWSDEATKAVRNRYVTDGPLKLAKELGTTCWAVTAKARRLGIGSTRKTPPKSFKWTKAMVAAIRERYVAEGGDSLAREFSLNIGTIRRKASSLGLHTIAGHAVAGRKRAECSESCDIHYFDQWSPDMAYILGFIFADACLNRKRTDIRVLLSAKDECVLEFIRKQLNVRSKIIHYESSVDDRGWSASPQVLLVISSTVLCQQLEKLGLHPGKTWNNDQFPQIPDEVFAHFARGYLDGDGSIHLAKDFCSVSLVGSPRFIRGLRDGLVRLAGVKRKRVCIKVGKTTNYAGVYWSANKDVRCLNKFLYPKGYTFCLERKRRKLDQWLATDHRENQPKRLWTAKEKEILRKHYQKLGPAKIGRMLGRDKGTVHNKAKELGLTTKPEQINK